MRADEELDPRIGAWLMEGPEELPEMTRHAIGVATEVMPQKEKAWVSRPAFALALVAAAAAVAAVLTLPGLIPQRGSPLPTGTPVAVQHATQFAIPFEYVVPKGSHLGEVVGRPDFYQFNLAGDRSMPAVAVRLVTRVNADPCDVTAGDRAIARSEELVDYLGRIPELRAEAVTTSMVDGRAALQLTVSPETRAGCEAVALWPGYEPLTDGIEPGTSLRYTIVDVDGSVVLIAAVARDLDQWLPTADRFIQSIRFAP